MARMWALRGVHPNQISHLRSAFYTDDFFTPLPTIEDDTMMPVVQLTHDFNPDIVTVAFDPEASGPDTHCTSAMSNPTVANALKKLHGCQAD